MAHRCIKGRGPILFWIHLYIVTYSKIFYASKQPITTVFDAMKRKLSPKKDADTPCDKQEKIHRGEHYNL